VTVISAKAPAAAAKPNDETAYAEAA
jgi:hypothetical protein